MADLTDLQSAQSVKIAGANPSSGAEDNFLDIDSTGKPTVKLNDGSGSSITSTTIDGKQLLDVNSPPVDGIKQTFSANTTDLVAASTPTDIFTITGSATKTIRVTYIGISATENTSATRDILLIKRSTANSAGTFTTSSAIPHDSNNSAATAIVRAYTANPTLGTTVGVVRSVRIQLLATNVTNPTDRIEFDFGNRPGQAIVLRGTNEVFAVNLNSVTSSSNLFDINIEWTEE